MCICAKTADCPCKKRKSADTQKERHFFEKEKIPNKIKNLPNDVAYIWEIVTDKKYAGRGIANKLINYILEKYDNIPIYSCIDTTNIPSLRLHEKNGFKILYNFDKNSGNKLTHHVIMGANV